MEFAPETEVAMSSERPRSATWAYWMAWVALAQTIFKSVDQMSSVVTLYLGTFTLIGIIPTIPIVIQLGHGKRWARDVLTILIAFAVFQASQMLLMAHFMDFPWSALEWLGEILRLAYMLVMYFLLTKSESQVWFEQTPRRLILSILVSTILLLPLLAPRQLALLHNMQGHH